MFNPYSVRPIGSKRFEEHIQDVMVSRYYERDEAAEVDLCIDHAEAPWGSSLTKLDDGWDRLVVAVISLAILDYMNAYEYKNRCEKKDDEKSYWVWESRCLQLENFFFRKNELDYIFEGVLKTCHKGEKAMRDLEKRLSQLIFWSRGLDRGRKQKCRA